jgi:hypothetical protein
VVEGESKEVRYAGAGQMVIRFKPTMLYPTEYLLPASHPDAGSYIGQRLSDHLLQRQRLSRRPRSLLLPGTEPSCGSGLHLLQPTGMSGTLEKERRYQRPAAGEPASHYGEE